MSEYGPQFPDQDDLYRAQDKPLEADRAGSSETEYRQLVEERQQTELSYLAGYDRELMAGHRKGSRLGNEHVEHRKR